MNRICICLHIFWKVIIMMFFNLLPAVRVDIQLPVMDGYAVARELRKNDELAMIPIIAVTSYAMTGDKEKAFDAGATGYIEKPIDPDTFIAQMEAFL